MRTKERTPKMQEVCKKCFNGDWQAMLDFARDYTPDARNPDVQLGKRFRDIIGTRNRSTFWRSVDARSSSSASGESVSSPSSKCGFCESTSFRITKVETASGGSFEVLGCFGCGAVLARA